MVILYQFLFFQKQAEGGNRSGCRDSKCRDAGTRKCIGKVSGLGWIRNFDMQNFAQCRRNFEEVCAKCRTFAKFFRNLVIAKFLFQLYILEIILLTALNYSFYFPVNPPHEILAKFRNVSRNFASLLFGVHLLMRKLFIEKSLHLSVLLV
jgi:hypothetical protein